MIVIDYQDRRPLYEQIVEKFKLLILRGVLKPDEQMPSVRQLAVQLSINPNTVQRAYLELERRGYIYSRPGKGSVVAAFDSVSRGKQAEVLAELPDIVEKALAAGLDEQALCAEISRLYALSAVHKGGN